MILSHVKMSYWFHIYQFDTNWDIANFYINNLNYLLSLPLFSRYADAVLSDTEVFQKKLVKEMNEMIEKHFDDESVPEVSLSDLFNKFYIFFIKLNLL